jgi:NAD(P)-dependent dehydrogenase (short-subunit alcohol dehydrogenase family)
MDVTSIDSIAAAERSVTERIGPVDVLVNNAAVLLHEHDAVLAIPRDTYRRTRIAAMACW